jgi:hypothetical protein
VATDEGCIFNYLMNVPKLAARHGTRLCYLSSLRNISVLNTVTGDAVEV